MGNYKWAWERTAKLPHRLIRVAMNQARDRRATPRGPSSFLVGHRRCGWAFPVRSYHYSASAPPRIPSLQPDKPPLHLPRAQATYSSVQNYAIRSASSPGFLAAKIRASLPTPVCTLRHLPSMETPGSPRTAPAAGALASAASETTGPKKERCNARVPHCAAAASAHGKDERKFPPSTTRRWADVCGPRSRLD
ncbi:hypothetical protein K470DRAFT_25381 [Piedraia hortae CBS 480.64]|uniref:Uncharacterized protein n=1 Tax=Piedraia hortae CBS 480.64 TaxID=1314780 RepID=A0A6A7C315_9PEZI|nr:hypothetical protein K470DRAFT_25381 [Piedraia hortae CBS 480.64]